MRDVRKSLSDAVSLLLPDPAGAGGQERADEVSRSTRFRLPHLAAAASC